MVDLAKYQERIDVLKKYDDYSMAGSEGFCFIEGKKIIKIYDEPKDACNVEDFTIYKSPRLAFPIFYVYKNEKVYGEVMPYFNAKTLDLAINSRSKIEDLIDNYRDIIFEINLFPDIYMEDMSFVKNILYSPGKGFYLIDTTSWKKDYNSDSKNIRLLNSAILYVFNSIIFDASMSINVLIDLREGYWSLKSNTVGRNLLQLLKSNLNGDYQLIELLSSYKEVIKSYYNYDIKTLGDIKKYTKIIKNS